jgi:predicted MFS family arabinose efflux permease
MIDAWKPDQALRRAIPALGLTQMIGWGTTYYLPAVLGATFQRDLGLDATTVFGAITVMLITSALLGIPLGRLMDRKGARVVMPAGSALMALGLIVLSQAQGMASFMAAWLLMGVAMPLTLSTGAYAALAQMAGVQARRAIGMLMLFGGFAASIFWPLTLWLDGAMGWRMAVLLYAGVHLVLCAPLHWFCIGAPSALSGSAGRDGTDHSGTLHGDARGKAAALLVVCFSCSGFISWGLDLHLITILQELGLTAAAAVVIASFKGPVTLLARGADLLMAGRMSPIIAALAAGGFILLALLVLLLLGQGTITAVIFILAFGFGTGLMTVARATLPLTLLGSLGYATTLGRLALPTQLIFAVSPMLFGMMIGHWGLSAALLIAVAAALVTLLSLVMLWKLPQRR